MSSYAPPAHNEDYSAFRTRLLFDVLLPTFFLPPLITLATIRLLRPLAPHHALFAIFAIPIFKLITVFVDDFRQKRDAARQGARLVPRLKTNWPGNLDLLFRLMTVVRSSYLMELPRKIMEENGTTTINLRLLWVDQILTMDEGLVKFVLATGFEHFDKGVRQKEMMETFLGNGIFNRDGEIWKYHRSMTRPFFARERISDFEHFDRYASRTLQILDDIGPNEPVDVQDLFSRFTLDTASAFLFNTEMDTLGLPLPKAFEATMGPKGSLIEGSFGDFATAFEESQQVIVDRARRKMLWKFYELFVNKGTAPSKVIEDFLNPIVARHLELKRGGKVAKGEETSFLEYLVANTDDVNLIKEELLNILLASRDTTASLLASVVYLLSQDRKALENLRAEILSICPEGSTPSYEDLRGMKYLRAVLNETLRLFPPVPGNTRATRDAPVIVPTSPTTDWGKSTDPRPYYIPANCSVNYFPILIHKRKDLWGPDADDFDPMRWLDDGSGRLQKMVKNPLMFVPFNAGPRICLGQQFALNEASYFLVRLLQVYDDFELALDAQPEGSVPPAQWEHEDGRAAREKVWFAGALTLYIKGGLWVRFRKARLGTKNV